MLILGKNPVISDMDMFPVPTAADTLVKVYEGSYRVIPFTRLSQF